MPRELPSAIRHIAPSALSSRIAAAEFEQRVHIWDLAQQTHLTSFDTILDFGGRRLAMDNSGKRCVAAAYRRQGIACYDTANGTELWRRKDLTRVQKVSIPPHSARVYCSFAAGPSHILDLSSGKTLARISGAKRLWSSARARHLIVQRNGKFFHLLKSASKKVIQIPKTSFGILDVSFSPDSVCVSETEGNVRCFSLADGGRRWKLRLPEGSHLLRVAYSPTSQCFVGVGWSYQTGGPLVLFKIHPLSGSFMSSFNLGNDRLPEFCDGNSTLLLASGRMFSLEPVKQIGKLSFPRRSDLPKQ